MNDMAMNGSLTVNEKAYRILRLLGKGKGGYSYLAESEGDLVVIKQIHHEPCDYYSFGNKIEAELRDYERLQKAGIRIPRMHAVDRDAERIVKDYIEGPTVMKLVSSGAAVEPYLPQVRDMAAKAMATGLNIDYYPTNFVVQDGLLWYVDYECNDYSEQWDFEHWGIQYWQTKVNFRSYRDEDYEAVCNFLIKLNRKDRTHINWNWARFEWMMEHPEFDKSARSSIGLWWSDGIVVGAAIYDMYFGEAFCGALPEYEALYPEILDYACRELKDDSGLAVAINTENTAEIRAAELAGFERIDQKETIMELSLGRDFSSNLPEGLQLREMDQIADRDVLEWLFWQGFDHGDDREAFERSRNHVPHVRRHFNKALCLSAANPSGEPVSHCSLWFHQDTDYAYVEPVCTIPGYRGKDDGVERLKNAVKTREDVPIRDRIIGYIRTDADAVAAGTERPEPVYMVAPDDILNPLLPGDEEGASSFTPMYGFNRKGIELLQAVYKKARSHKEDEAAKNKTKYKKISKHVLKFFYLLCRDQLIIIDSENLLILDHLWETDQFPKSAGKYFNNFEKCYTCYKSLRETYPMLFTMEFTSVLPVQEIKTTDDDFTAMFLASQFTNDSEDILFYQTLIDFIRHTSYGIPVDNISSMTEFYCSDPQRVTLMKKMFDTASRYNQAKIKTKNEIQGLMVTI